MNTRNLLVSVLMLVCVMLSACAPAVTATATHAPTAVPPTAVPSDQTTFHSPANASFRLPLSITYGPEWEAQVGINVINIIYKGNPPQPNSEWWGPDIILLNGAQVADPEDMTKLMLLPDDSFAYITSLPGVKVIKGPESVSPGGLQGNQLIVDQTPFHPFLQLKDDYAMNGQDVPEFKQLMILLDVNGEQQILLWFPEPRETFDQRYLLVQEIFNSITFGK